MLKNHSVLKKFVVINGDQIINKRQRIILKCRKCNTVMFRSFYQLLRKPFCSCYGRAKLSSGAKKVQHILINADVDFDKEYSFADCLNVNRLRFDFAVFKDGELLFLIEFNGRQHYMPVDYFGGSTEFSLSNKRDFIKVSYCAKNNIPLLVIPYFAQYSDMIDLINSYFIKTGVRDEN
jgi:hypothetical protein